MTSARLTPEADGSYTLVVKGITLDIPTYHNAPLSDGQRRAIHAKLNHLDAMSGQVRGTAKQQAKDAASEHLGRHLDSTNDLASTEASWLLDWLEEQIEAQAA